MIETVINEGFRRCKCEYANTLSPNGWCCGALGRSGACGDANATGYVLCDDVRDTPACLQHAYDVDVVELKIIVPKSDTFDRNTVPDWVIRNNRATLNHILTKYSWCFEGD